MLSKLITTTCGAAGIIALLMTAGCSAASAGDDDSSAPLPAATAASPTGSAVSPAPESEPDAPRCLTPDLAGSLKVVEGGASAGHYELAIVLENEGAEPCVLQGWPGVSFVGDDDGTQLGASGSLDRLSPNEPVLLDPGSAAQSVVEVADARNYGEECGLTPADGFRVYPPGEKRSLFLQSDELTLEACSSTDDKLLDVQAFRPAE